MPDSVEKALGRIEAKNDAIKEDIKEIRDLVVLQNGRIRVLELDSAQSKGQWKIAGTVGGIVGSILSVFGGWLIKWLPGG